MDNFYFNRFYYVIFLFFLFLATIMSLLLCSVKFILIQSSCMFRSYKRILRGLNVLKVVFFHRSYNFRSPPFTASKNCAWTIAYQPNYISDRSSEPKESCITLRNAFRIWRPDVLFCLQIGRRTHLSAN